MDGQYSWKRTEEIEINLADLFCKICRQWKQIILCALAFAIILGGYGWTKEKESSDMTVSDAAEEAELTEAEEQAVTDAVQLKSEIAGLEAYLDHSVLMQIDPYHKSKAVMAYEISGAEKQDMPAVIESYLNFVLNGGAADMLKKSGDSWKMDKIYMAELISAYQKSYSSAYQTIVDGLADANRTEEVLFCVEVTGKDADTTEKMALEMQEVLEKYSKQAAKTAGSHRLSLVSSMQSITADSGLQSQQHDKKLLLSSNKSNLRAATDAFSEEQMAVYKEAVMEKSIYAETEKTEPREDESDAEEPGKKSGFSLKYVLLGLAGGVFLYCGIFFCWYLCSNKIRSADEMKERYLFPLYGEIPLKDGHGRSGRRAARIWHDAYGCTEEQTLNRVRLACEQQKITEIYAAADFSMSISEKECLERMSKQLKKQGIIMEAVENVGGDISVWDRLIETKYVLMVCRIGTSTYQMIDNAMGFYLENGIQVMGAAVFSQD